jgi:hypothetical protein
MSQVDQACNIANSICGSDHTPMPLDEKPENPDYSFPLLGKINQGSSVDGDWRPAFIEASCLCRQSSEAIQL